MRSVPDATIMNNKIRTSKTTILLETDAHIRKRLHRHRNRKLKGFRWSSTKENKT